MNKYFVNIIILLLATFNCKLSTAQDASARYEIDAKRLDVSAYDKDALPRSREFIRLDSTYYVGYLYEGLFKYARAADYLGYKNCIISLRKAFLLFEKDNKSNIRNVVAQGQYNTKQSDIIDISNALYESYSNIEQPDSAIWILEKIRQWNVDFDFMEYHIKSAWTIHRNRFRLNKYSFLKNSVAANEQLALNHLHSALAQGNTTANFYLTIIHNYLQDIDSTKFYYEYLLQNGGISYNNYGHYKNTMGQFGEAITFMERDKFAFDKRLIEAYYFLPTLYINSGNSLQGIRMANEIIAANGSTPGFGWYNIALARSYLYNGQLDSAQKAIDKAAQFKELHLGTTLGQSHYDFAINIVKLLLINQKIERVKFFNTAWWYTPANLVEISKLYGEKFVIRFALVNEIASNPERQNVIYTLFSSENVIGFDEIWNLLKDISPTYFMKLYKEKAASEKRENIQRYMQFFYANFLYKDGEEKESKNIFENILYNVPLDTAHEKLYLARIAENLSHQYLVDDEKEKYDKMMAYTYYEFPQTIPFSGLKMRMKLNITGEDNISEKIKNELEDCNINWVKDNSIALIANVTLQKNKDKYEASYWVENAAGLIVVARNKLIFKNTKGVGKELGLRFFGVNGPLEYETQNN